MKRYLLGFIFTVLITVAYAQDKGAHSKSEDEQIESHAEDEARYLIAFTLGVTYVPEAFENGHSEDAVFVPTTSVDFFYRIRSNWSLGLMADLELKEYIVNFGRKDLNREYALILAIMAGYEILEHWGVFLGGGIELERHKNLAVFRVGTDYQFPLTNNWNIAPSFFYDFKEEYRTWAIALGISKKF